LAEARASTAAQMALPIEANADISPSHHMNVSTMPPALSFSKPLQAAADTFIHQIAKNQMVPVPPLPRAPYAVGGRSRLFELPLSC